MAATSAAPGEVLGGRYKLVQPLARGGMASVWVAEDTLLGRKVAVKTLHPELAVDQALRTRFRREAIAAASLAHPAIVTTYDTGEDDGLAYIVMELVDGPTLRRLLDRQGRLEIREALRIGRWVAGALEHAHRNGIVHRDIKPANVLVPSEGPAKVTDFGIAKSDGVSDLTRTGTVVGTARYLSPEQVRGDPVDARADVYALGLVFYEMLAGKLPFSGETEMATALARLTTAPRPLHQERPDIPSTLDRVVAHCLTIDPERRFASGGALATALDDVMSGAAPALPVAGDATAGATAPPGRTKAGTPPPAAPPPAGPPRSGRGAARPRQPRPRKRGRFLLALLAIAVFVGGAAAGYFALRDNTKGNSSSPSGNPIDISDAVQIAKVDAFDPPPGDRSENGGSVRNVIDGDAETTWSTEHYNTRNWGGIKHGVGLVLTLASSTDVHSVEADATESGWGVEIYVSDTTHDSLSGWGQPVATKSDAGTQAKLSIDPAVSGKEVLVWFTRLPASNKLTVSEVKVA